MSDKAVVLIKLVVLIRRVRYGRELFYPGCDFSRLLCKLLDQKTLTIETIEILRKEGFEVEIKSDLKRGD